VLARVPYREAVDQAIQDGKVDAEQMNTWWRSLEEADRAGTFLWSMTGFAFAGRRHSYRRQRRIVRDPVRGTSAVFRAVMRGRSAHPSSGQTGTSKILSRYVPHRHVDHLIC
jgi:hypothetical protein